MQRAFETTAHGLVRRTLTLTPEAFALLKSYQQRRQRETGRKPTNSIAIDELIKVAVRAMGSEQA